MKAPLDVLRVAILSMLWLASSAVARAQESDGDDDEETARIEAPALAAPVTWQPGAPMEAWLATGITVGVAALSLTGGIILSEFARRDERLALDPMSTQRDASGWASSARDLMLGANILFVAAGVLVGTALVWSLALPFGSHSVPTAQASLRLDGFFLEGTF